MNSMYSNGLTRLVAIVPVLVLAACSASSEPVATTIAVAAEATTSTVADTPAEDGSTNETAPASTTTSIPVEPLFLEGLDVPTIEQFTPRSGGGHRPLLEWETVNGTSAYEVSFFGQDGFLYWAWTGPETSIFLGGVSTPDGTPGPAALEGMSWAVVALDDTGKVIAQSHVRSISR